MRRAWGVFTERGKGLSHAGMTNARVPDAGKKLVSWAEKKVSLEGTQYKGRKKLSRMKGALQKYWKGLVLFRAQFHILILSQGHLVLFLYSINLT